MRETDAQQIVRRLFAAFAAGDMEGMRSLMAPDMRAHVTNAAGGTDTVSGADEYLGRVAAMDLPSAKLDMPITQLASITANQVLVMVEIHAQRSGRTLHAM